MLVHTDADAYSAPYAYADPHADADADADDPGLSLRGPHDVRHAAP